jgi:hypothetical protein
MYLPYNLYLQPNPMWIQEILNSYAVDSVAQTLLQKLAVNPTEEPLYSLNNGLIRYKEKI